MHKSAHIILTITLTALFSMVNYQPINAGVIDRVVAFVDDEAITLVEFNRYLRAARVYTPDISDEDAMNIMVNRRLLLKEAGRLMLKSSDEDQLINTYIDIRVGAFIKIPPEEIRIFYSENRKKFKDASFNQVRERIEAVLTERELNKKLREHIKKLRAQSYIRINLSKNPD